MPNSWQPVPTNQLTTPRVTYQFSFPMVPTTQLTPSLRPSHIPHLRSVHHTFTPVLETALGSIDCRLHHRGYPLYRWMGLWWKTEDPQKNMEDLGLHFWVHNFLLRKSDPIQVWKTPYPLKRNTAKVSSVDLPQRVELKFRNHIMPWYARDMLFSP